MAEVENKGKSIVDPKYRVKKEPDWLAKLIGEHATLTKTVTKTVTEGEGDKATKKEVKEQRPAGVDVDGLFRLAKVNGIDVASFEAQRGSHGFAGRFRMSLRNMLDAATRRRHGLFVPRGETQRVWVDADAAWLKSGRGAPDKPTHTRDGAKIEQPKADKAPAASKEEAPAS